MSIIELPKELSDDAKLTILLAYHNVQKDVDIEEEAKAVVILALNRDDITTVEYTEEEGLVIGYSGDGWESNE